MSALASADDGRFDAVLLQHVAMNISDRARLYREIRRVLKSDGRFAPNMGSPFAKAFQSDFLWLFVGMAWAGQILARLDPTDYETQVRSAETFIADAKSSHS
jgi:ubiquinone/menaquinone biosynthesis C-methylase UbiE